MRRRTLAVCTLTLLLGGGCSQVDALAPVSGQSVAGVRYAANDILLQQHISIKVAPVCTGSGAKITCEGTTTDSQSIVVTATAPDASTMEVAVGTRVLYSGSVQNVLDSAGTQ